MAVTNVAAGTFAAGATVNIHGALGDGERKPRGPHKDALVSGAASASGGLALTVTAEPAQPLFAVGPAPGGGTKTVLTFAA